MVYFPTAKDSLYQLRPWFHALKALNAIHPIVCVFKDSRTAKVVRKETDFDCVTLARYGQLDEILALSEVKLALYVNHDPVNFESLRFSSMVHVYLGHGDSDKGVSVSNQVKAYDLCFLAGQAALDRTLSAVMLVRRRGPQRADRPAAARRAPRSSSREPSPDGRQTVLYAPTWEASQPSVSYGSLETHGEKIMQCARRPLPGDLSPAPAQRRHQRRRMARPTGPYVCSPSASTPTSRSRSRSPTPTC